ncbi:hypothetical protein AJ80_05205 [Polytolypa hystricis UAMH7299]|uniref:Myb-like domain-containing protein n=1 Tax=Polytolypa hystricis (strain UAMH7299) TaxID=1447883 RepID=A0A2B7Y582_POLH7|nr:hypothetical protein AJ80_05205 [Polytolypa hystricis UAMH7299]
MPYNLFQRVRPDKEQCVWQPHGKARYTGCSTADFMGDFGLEPWGSQAPDMEYTNAASIEPLSQGSHWVRNGGRICGWSEAQNVSTTGHWPRAPGPTQFSQRRMHAAGQFLQAGDIQSTFVMGTRKCQRQPQLPMTYTGLASLAMMNGDEGETAGIASELSYRRPMSITGNPTYITHDQMQSISSTEGRLGQDCLYGNRGKGACGTTTGKFHQPAKGDETRSLDTFNDGYEAIEMSLLDSQTWSDNLTHSFIDTFTPRNQEIVQPGGDNEQNACRVRHSPESTLSSASLASSTVQTAVKAENPCFFDSNSMLPNSHEPRAAQGSNSPSFTTEPSKGISGHILMTQSIEHTVRPILRKKPTRKEAMPVRRGSKDEFLVRCKLSGMSYKEIKERGSFSEAESTLRGRFRTLTKKKEHRLRKPGWQEKDLRLLRDAVLKFSSELRPISSGETRLPRISWKQVGEYIWKNGGSYHFGNATCKKKWTEIQDQG